MDCERSDWPVKIASVDQPQTDLQEISWNSCRTDAKISDEKHELSYHLEGPYYIPVIQRHRGAVAVTQLMSIHASRLIP